MLQPLFVPVAAMNTVSLPRLSDHPVQYGHEPIAPLARCRQERQLGSDTQIQGLRA